MNLYDYGSLESLYLYMDVANTSAMLGTPHRLSSLT